MASANARRSAGSRRNKNARSRAVPEEADEAAEQDVGCRNASKADCVGAGDSLPSTQEEAPPKCKLTDKPIPVTPRSGERVYGYARVSSRDQNLARQIDALRAFGVEP